MVMQTPDDSVRRRIDELYRAESRRILATLIRLLGDFDLAEDALHDAFAAALAVWPSGGIPANPVAWLVSTGRFKGIDQIRRRARLTDMGDCVDLVESSADASQNLDLDAIKDDQLRLIFTCCHPALSPEARVALTLREVCGLTTEEIARAFLTSAPTIAQRIVRAKAKIRTAKIPYEVPSSTDLPQRLDGVLQAIYLVFNEGYSASSGESLTRADLCVEAIRLARTLTRLLPDPEATGILALMLLHDSRRVARAAADGGLILLEEQDRSMWDRASIDEGLGLLAHALRSRRFGVYTLQAAIAAIHAEARVASETDWPQIVAFYDLLLRASQSPVVELNRAAAVAMRDGPEGGLTLMDEILGRGELAEYHLAHSARAEMCRRLGRTAEALRSYERALQLTAQEPERRFLQARIAALHNPG